MYNNTNEINVISAFFVTKGIFMKIINYREFYFKEKEINKFLKLFNETYIPKTIIIYEKRVDLFKNLFSMGLTFFSIILGKTEGIYNPISDMISIFVFSENDDGDDKQSFQLYSLHALCHEARHRYQYNAKLDMSEEDADKFATEFMDKNSKAIKKIMKWKDEWEVEEY